jgi:hypothetical protein
MTSAAAQVAPAPPAQCPSVKDVVFGFGSNLREPNASSQGQCCDLCRKSLHALLHGSVHRASALAHDGCCTHASCTDARAHTHIGLIVAALLHGPQHDLESLSCLCNCFSGVLQFYSHVLCVCACVCVCVCVCMSWRTAVAVWPRVSEPQRPFTRTTTS